MDVKPKHWIKIRTHPKFTTNAENYKQLVDIPVGTKIYDGTASMFFVVTGRKGLEYGCKYTDGHLRTWYLNHEQFYIAPIRTNKFRLGATRE